MILPVLERARRALRSLVQLLGTRQRRAVFTDFEDDLGQTRSVDLPLVAVGVNQARFRDKVTAYIREHDDPAAIRRLRRNLPLTETDLDELERILIEQGDGTPEAREKVSAGSASWCAHSSPSEDDANAVVTVLHDIERAAAPAVQAGAR
ncbi:MAG: type I restriction-modification enzyme R subunit C-terminal domain-containing protein [Brachybacterium sp.]|uniref:type I restriction-modification enzyme R subunit C-terminal domain-containing protein n=1 Tax=Brachybacterium sp. TaxID=1891286 RepID=UPI003F92DD06